MPCHGNCYRAWRKIRCATLMKKKRNLHHGHNDNHQKQQQHNDQHQQDNNTIMRGHARRDRLYKAFYVARAQVALLFHCIMFSRLHSSDASNLVGTIPQRASRKSLGCPSRIMIGTRSMMRSRDELLQMLAKHSMHASTLSEPHGYGWLNCRRFGAAT